MKRHTNRTGSGTIAINGCASVFSENLRKRSPLSIAIVKLAEYEDLEEKGELLRLSCKVGDPVYVIAKCEEIWMVRDDDYINGTGAIECPFELSCDFEDCNDENVRIFESYVTAITIESNGIFIYIKNLREEYSDNDWGKKIFHTFEEACQAL